MDEDSNSAAGDCGGLRPYACTVQSGLLLDAISTITTIDSDQIL